MSSILKNIFMALPDLKEQHKPGCNTYQLLTEVARQEVEKIFNSPDPCEVDFPPFGSLVFPYYKMGAVDSLNLFDLDELIIFSFYWRNRERYSKAADIGANIGLHSVLMSKCGFNVQAYEPDPTHFSLLQKNVELNHCKNIEPKNMAVSSRSGNMEFVRVVGNTTGSHLAGSKQNPYGELERFPVKLEGIASFISAVDLIKLDAEGHEKEIILATNEDDWKNTDALIEIENSENAAIVFEHFTKLGVNLFAQKIGWQKVQSSKDVPVGYREGMLFASCAETMPWS